VAAGLTNRQIASKVFVGVKSVETYRARVLKKLNIKTREDLVRFALDAGLLTAQDPRKAL
jgi:DNA-binding NarL/FixJ family response regulator